MKLRRTTWIWVALALILGGAVYIGEVRGRPQREAARARAQQLFDFQTDEIEQIAIEPRDGEALNFVQAETEPATWRMTEPTRSPVSDPAISFLVNLLVEGQQQQAFNIEPQERAAYDLAEPLATITITTTQRDEPYHLLLGRPNYEGTLIYALREPEAPVARASANLEVVLVPIDLQYAVERELNEWLDAPTAAPADADDAAEAER